VLNTLNELGAKKNSVDSAWNILVNPNIKTRRDGTQMVIPVANQDELITDFYEDINDLAVCAVNLRREAVELRRGNLNFSTNVS